MSSLLFPKPFYHKCNVKWRFLRKNKPWHVAPLFVHFYGFTVHVEIGKPGKAGRNSRIQVQ